MRPDLRAALLELTANLKPLCKRLDWALRLTSNDYTAEQRAQLNSEIDDVQRQIRKLVDEIPEVASHAPPRIAAQLYHATGSTGDDAVEILTQALAAMQCDRERPTLPVVRLNPPEVEYAGKTIPVEPDHALAFQAMVEKHPERVGLTAVIGAHPERKMARLPNELKAIVDTTGKGSCLKLS